MLYFWSSVSVFLVVGVSACGGVSRLDGQGPGDGMAGNAAAGSGSGGAGSSAGSGGGLAGSPGAGSSAGGGGGADACFPFRDETPQPVTVTIRNDGPGAIYIGPREPRCGSAPPYEVRDASQSVISERGPCGSSCESWVLGNPVGGCVALCMPTEVTKLAAGETMTTKWYGLSATDTDLPKQCNASQLEGTVTCSTNKRVEPGTYTFSSSAGSQLICNGTPNSCPECVPSAGGGCTVSDVGITVAGTELSVKRRVELDATYGIIGSSGGGSNNTVTKSVALVFSPTR